jgi:hypothetical protein
MVKSVYFQLNLYEINVAPFSFDFVAGDLLEVLHLKKIRGVFVLDLSAG